MLIVDGEVAGWYAPAGSPSPEPAFFDHPPTSWTAPGAVELEGRMIGPVWELMSGNPDQVAADVAALFPGRGGRASCRRACTASASTRW